MNLSQIVYECGEIGRSNGTGQRVDSDWISFINRAQRTIAERNDWTWMHARNQVTIASGLNSVALGSTFKKLTAEESPVSFVYGRYNLPVKITSRERIESCGIWPLQKGPFSLPIPGGFSPIQVLFLERNAPGGQWALNTPPQYSVTQDATFNVSAYWYPRDLAGGDDRNEMTDSGDLSEAIVNMAKALAYRAEEVDSPKGLAAKAIAEEAIGRALYSDGAQRWGGRTLRL